VTFDGHRSDDFRPYVYKTEDFGRTWENITNNLPDGHSVYVIREDFKNKNLLFVGTEFGVFASVNGGKSWMTSRICSSLPKRCLGRKPTFSKILWQPNGRV